MTGTSRSSTHAPRPASSRRAGLPTARPSAATSQQPVAQGCPQHARARRDEPAALAKMIDPMANLDMEKKMGFGMKDVDDFLEKAKDVEQKINDIKSGKISVEQLERSAS